MSIRNFFTAEQQQRIVEAIAQAERNTSGEVRVHLEKSCKSEALDRAADVFHRLKMDRTALRNGVLFYLAVNDRKFAVIGDRDINEKVPGNFWNEIKEVMLAHFQQQEFTEGICQGIIMAGEKLKTFFPVQENDRNELENEISFDE